MKSLRWLLLLAIANATVVSAQTKPQKEHTQIVFTHVAVLDSANASLQQDMTVVIVGENIAEVGKAAGVNVPKAAQVINGRGKFLMPGLWDMHVHTFRHNPRSTNTWFFPLFIANGITGVRDMGTKGDDFPQAIQFRKGLADGSFLGPRYGAVGWMVDGPDPFWPNSDVVSTPQEARDFVRRVKAAGIEFVKVYSKLRPEEYFAIADEAQKLGIPFAGHVPDVISAAAASDAGQRSMEHLRNVDVGCSTKEQELLQAKTWGPQQRKEMRDTYDQPKCEQLLQRFARNQTWQVPTSSLFVQDRSRLRELLTTDPKSKYLPDDVRALWQQQLPKLETSPQREEQRQENQQIRLTIIAMMNKAGVPMMAGTDVGNPFLLPGFSLHDELAAFVRAGLTPGEALKTATYNPAKYLGMLDRLGTVEKGKFADLVLLDANPLGDIRNTRKIRAVVVNGRYLDRAALDRLLAAAASAGSQ
jgi:Amidohydrolase family